MKGDKLIEAIDRGVRAIVRPFTWIASVVLGMMVLLLTIHIAARFLFNKPLLGTAEIVGLMLCTVIWLVVAYTEIARGHIRISLVTERLPRRVQSILGSIVYFISGVFFIVMAWQSAVLLHMYLYPIPSYTHLLYIPLFPFIGLILIGSLVLGLHLLMKGFHPLPTDDEGKGAE